MLPYFQWVHLPFRLIKKSGTSVPTPDLFVFLFIIKYDSGFTPSKKIRNGFQTDADVTNTKSNCSHACVGCEIRECREGSRNTTATLRELLKANNNSPCACSMWVQLQKREENRSKSDCTVTV